MRDFYPEDMAVRNTIFEAWMNTARMFGFAQYDSCVVESLDLLKRKAGEEIVEQIYSFTDKSGRELALRPEMTPTLARMIAAKQGSLTFPLKWFTIAQCFRYERMSRGRKREHYQWNMDIIGEESASAEAEVVAAGIEALFSLGFNKADFQVHFSSRALLSDLLTSLGVEQQYHQNAFLALDKHGKISDAEISEMLTESAVDKNNISKIFNLLTVSSLNDAADILGKQTPSIQNINLFMALLSSYNLADVMKFDIAVVRGLAYYTGIVFEAFDTMKEFRAIFGGGRYDNLLKDVGGQPASGVGLGFGDVVVSELMENKNKIQVNTTSPTLAIGYMEDEQRSTAMTIAAAIRSTSSPVDLATHSESAKTFFSRANKGGFHKAIYVGPDDVASGKIRIKDMITRTEQEKNIADIVLH